MEKPEYLTNISARIKIKNPKKKNRYFLWLLNLFSLFDVSKKQQISATKGTYIGIPNLLERVSIIFLFILESGQLIIFIFLSVWVWLIHLNKSVVFVSCNLGAVIDRVVKVFRASSVLVKKMLFSSFSLFCDCMTPLNKTNFLLSTNPFLAIIVMLL